MSDEIKREEDGSFKLVNRMPSFKVMLEGGLADQIKEAEALEKEFRKQVNFLKKMQRSLRGKTDQHLFEMLGDDHEAVKEYRRMEAELNAYIAGVNDVKEEK